MKPLFLVFSILSIAITSCNNNNNDNSGEVYFGGEIINPKGETVIFYNKKENISDTLYLDKNNRFNHYIPNLKSGVYTFWHGGEIQLIILEPNDSLMIRLNTYDFDKSLVFTGIGSKKNNYLLKTFLNNEKETRKLVKYCEKQPEIFKEFITTRHQKELSDFYAFKAKNTISDYASLIIKSNIDYHNYADKEIYPFAYFGENKMIHLKDLPDNFYDYRTHTDYNIEALSQVFAYKRFLFFHFDNLAVTDYYTTNPYHSKFNRHEFTYNKNKLNLVDSLVSNTYIKNNILKFKTREFINNSKNQDEINEILSLYLSKTTNKDDIKYMNSLIATLDNLKPGKGLPDLMVLNAKDKEYTIADVVDRPTIIYFWSSNYKNHYKKSHQKVKTLKNKFPEIGFISININDNSDNTWKKIINQYQFNLDSEYRFKHPKDALKTLAVSYLYKVIIVDKYGNIIRPNVNIFNQDFESDLKSMIQKKELVFN